MQLKQWSNQISVIWSNLQGAISTKWSIQDSEFFDSIELDIKIPESKSKKSLAPDFAKELKKIISLNYVLQAFYYNIVPSFKCTAINQRLWF